jgi:hypothetical protein
MFDKGWFDDAVGRVEGFKIFGELMESGSSAESLADSYLALIMCCLENLLVKQKVIDPGIVATLTKKLEGGERHGVRMSLICLEIIGMSENGLELCY